MPILRLQCSFMMDTAFARDRMVITPHFNAGSEFGIPGSPDADGLCSDLATALQGWSAGSQEIDVKAYDAQGTPPVFPIGHAVNSVGVLGQSAQPREVALCLSYYSEQNRPKRRGRLFIPAALLDFQAAQRQPTSANLTKVGDLAAIFANLGGTNIDWGVYSRVDDAFHPATNWWVDNEWDTIRSRGTRADTRITGSLDE